VVNLLLDIQSAFGATMIFIAHDLSVVRFFSDEIAVMYLGQIVELGHAQRIYDPPYHPYTVEVFCRVLARCLLYCTIMKSTIKHRATPDNTRQIFSSRGPTRHRRLP
jgi:ABC-type oligopeptide transport system ATPase subunit